MLPKRTATLAFATVLASVLGSLVVGGSARAQAAGAEPAVVPTEANDRPWAKDVPEDAQKSALGLFEEGNKLFEVGQHAAAMAKYREALKLWDHPAIRYNAAVTLINLDQPRAAYENLERALRFGEAPLGTETHKQALTYRKLLQGQLAELNIACAEPDAEVTLDGKSLLFCPGEVTRWLLPGPHQLVARKPGFLTETRSLNLLPGKPSEERIALRGVGSPPTKSVRRWPVWKPWTVLGAGALLALAGVPFILDARSSFDAYDAGVAACAMNQSSMGCPAGMIPSTAVEANDRGRVENVAAISLFATGGAVAATAIALLILNLPRVVPAEETHASIAPLLGPGLVGLSLAVSR